jgi:iron complex transport system ATP-binding protein
MLIDARALSCGYPGGDDVLAGVSLGAAPGEFVAVAGPNGAGKSTLLRALSRVLRPRLGSVLLDGRDLYALTPRESALAVAVVPQEPALDFEFTAEELVLMGRAPHLGRFQAEGPRDREAVREAMERTGTWELRHRSVLELSGGERRRVYLARAFAQEPRVLLLDEPTTHLDLGFQAQFLRMVRALRRDRGVAVVASLHDLNVAAEHADRILLLVGGKPRASGRPAEVLKESVLREAYGAEVLVRPHPESGGPCVYVKS